MKTKIKLTTLIFVTLFAIAFFSLEDVEENFNYLLKDNNIICYNEKISKKDLNDFLLFYYDKVDSFYIGNKLSERKIGLENLLIILCNDSFYEWQNAKKFKSDLFENEIKEKFGLIKNKTDFFEKKISKDENIYGLYIWDYYLPAILIKTTGKKQNKFFIIIAEYNHHLIQTNYKKQIGIENFPDYQILIYLIDEGFTNYIFHYLRYFENINYGNFLYKNSIIFEKEKAKAIYDWIKKMYLERKFTENLQNFLFSDLLNPKKKIPDDFIFVFSVFYYSYINYFYGNDFLFNYLSFLYNGEYYSTDEVFSKFFQKSSKEILIELDEKLKE